LDKALRRQLGATNVDLDTDTGWAQFTLEDPVRIDLDAFEDAAYAASYTIRKIRLDISGRTAVARCARCEGDATRIELTGTGQVFELAGDVPANTPLRVIAITDEWTGEHVVFEVLEVIQEGSP